MAIIVYKCDTCKRTIDIPEKINGIERVNVCTITHGCRGSMYQHKRLQDHTRGSLPESVSGLDNWIQRKILHNHSQAVEQKIWLISHKLGALPTVSVFVDVPTSGKKNGRKEITPEDIIIIDENNIKLVFDRPRSGIAQLVGRQSAPTELDNSTTTHHSDEPLQISMNGEITVATRIGTIGEESVVLLGAEYVTSRGTTPRKEYVADDQPSVNSAWVDFDKVIIQGKIYTVRSFNGIVPDMVSGAINSGSTMSIKDIDSTNDQQFSDISSGDVLVLLSTPPHEVVDKVTDKYIDVTDAVGGSAIFYDSGEFFAPTDTLSNIYPHIQSV